MRTARHSNVRGVPLGKAYKQNVQKDTTLMEFRDRVLKLFDYEQ